LIGAVLAIDFRVMLIDEPDAFLHPPLVSWIRDFYQKSVHAPCT
jgi:ABC-type histidine transport system ATPase subunit